MRLPEYVRERQWAMAPGYGRFVVLLVVVFGAVLNMYFGLSRFEPAAIPGEESP